MTVFVLLSLQLILDAPDFLLLLSETLLEYLQPLLVVLVIALERTLVALFLLEFRLKVPIFLLYLVETVLCFSQDGLETVVFVIGKELAMKSCIVLTLLKLVDKPIKLIIVFL
jgi:hypothetical protein